jgi:hypothetical protein
MHGSKPRRNTGVSSSTGSEAGISASRHAAKESSCGSSSLDIVLVPQSGLRFNNSLHWAPDG